MQVTLSFVLLNLAPHFYFSTSNQSFISKQKQEEQEMEIIKIAVWIYIFSQKKDLLLRIYLSQEAKQEMNVWRSYSTLKDLKLVKSWKNPQFTQ